MATIPDAMLISISTPYSRQGLLYENYREYWSKEDEDVLVWKAPSVVMNPTLSEKMIEKEKAKDLSGLGRNGMQTLEKILRHSLLLRLSRPWLLGEG